ncbi:hypothetical protein HDU76_012855 [Blyttiomyces sp. JEL0837]|nr:hypothetical protein HDU76_012855 [Blyttiomyces sp. JEL0837]
MDKLPHHHQHQHHHHHHHASDHAKQSKADPTSQTSSSPGPVIKRRLMAVAIILLLIFLIITILNTISQIEVREHHQKPSPYGPHHNDNNKINKDNNNNKISSKSNNKKTINNQKSLTPSSTPVPTTPNPSIIKTKSIPKIPKPVIPIWSSSALSSNPLSNEQDSSFKWRCSSTDRDQIESGQAHRMCNPRLRVTVNGVNPCVPEGSVQVKNVRASLNAEEREIDTIAYVQDRNWGAQECTGNQAIYDRWNMFVHAEDEYIFNNSFQYGYHSFNHVAFKYLKITSPDYVRQHNSSFTRMLRPFLDDTIVGGNSGFVEPTGKSRPADH